MCNTILLESVKLRAWGACVLACFSCLRDCVLTWWRVYVIACLRAYVLGVLACLRAFVFMCFRAWRASVLGALTCSRAYRTYVLEVLACLRECVLVLMKCFIFLGLCVLGVLFCLICLTFQYLNLKILTAKNLCALLSWTYFLFTFWYQLIKLFETNSRVAGKSIDISNSYSCSKAISIFYNLYIHLLHQFL